MNQKYALFSVHHDHDDDDDDDDDHHHVHEGLGVFPVP